MSLVGPRPEVRRYVEMFRAEYDEILRIRPGITDLASLKYRDEAAILGRAADPEVEYVQRVLPEKIRLAKEYVRRQSLPLDLAIIFGTLLHLLGDRMPKGLAV
jgi:lipopolysaccharide/colanic/teichoic acid biosynthesis glycosyltransferase